MKDNTFERKQKEKRPVLAICYDFDKTLAPDDMQAQGFIQSVGYDVGEFWSETNALVKDGSMDQILAYMYKMSQAAKDKIVLTKEKLKEYGSNVSLFDGVRDWFDRIRTYGDSRDVTVEHYIISAGLKEMIEGTSIAGKFERIYASSFHYDAQGVAIWPAQVVNFTNKTQFLFRIEKGVLDVNDSGVNESFAPEEVRVPFRNMIYIGDSETDVPCMKLVNSYGGHSIGIYNAKTEDKTKVYKMMRDGRIKYYMPADYSEGTPLDRLVKSIIDRTAANEALENIHYRCKKEYLDEDKKTDAEEKKRWNLIFALETSESFAATHTIIKRLNACRNWTAKEIRYLLHIAGSNSQVKLILEDHDVEEFYQKILALADESDQPTEVFSKLSKK